MSIKNQIKNFAPEWIFKTLRTLKGAIDGTWPLNRAQKKLEKLASSETLTGQILHKMAFDRDPMLTLFADKYRVRDYVTANAGSQYLSKLHAVIESAEELKGVELPDEFVLKSNNGSGAMVIVTKTAPLASVLPALQRSENWNRYLIHPNNFDIELASKLVKTWLNQSYYYVPTRYPEWAYKNIKPVVMVEELMLDEDGNLPSDYKFFMINGTCEFIKIDSTRFSDHRADLFTSNWESIPGKYQYPPSEVEIKKPELLEEMIRVASLLTHDVDFLRVDLYQTKDGVKFGELTNYPGGGRERFEPSHLDIRFGRKWVTNISSNPD